MVGWMDGIVVIYFFGIPDAGFISGVPRASAAGMIYIYTEGFGLLSEDQDQFSKFGPH